ncbi:MAG: heparan-alpha-glucosaminide N-acetyltransferase domain-containing protein [Bacillota bacterium]
MKPKNMRYPFLDTYRGVVMVLMILFHLWWDMVYLFDYSLPFFRPPFSHILQRFICISFIGLSGFCFQFMKQPQKRGGLIFLCGWILTVGSFIFVPEFPNIFGVLTFIGSAIFLTIPLHHLLKNCKKRSSQMGFLLSFCMFLLLYNVNRGEIMGIPLPSSLYEKGYFFTYLGFLDYRFTSSDYFSILPWIFIFWMGYFLHHLFLDAIVKYEKLMAIDVPFLSLLGRHSLSIYMVHQPILYAFLSLIS